MKLWGIVHLLLRVKFYLLVKLLFRDVVFSSRHFVTFQSPIYISYFTDDTTSVCAGCLNIIDDDEVLEALSKEWHIECFRYNFNHQISIHYLIVSFTVNF